MLDFEVVQVTSGTVGGAGRAAVELHLALLNYGVNSTLITIDKPPARGIPSTILVKRNKFSLLKSFLGTKIHNRISSNFFFSLWSNSLENVMPILLGYDNKKTILHIHNSYNILSFRNLRDLTSLGYTLVHTLHDERIFTGGCHHSFSCREFERNCTDCPQLPRILNGFPSKNLTFQITSFKDSHKLNLIAPSFWIALESQRSTVFRAGNPVHIPNIFPEVESKISRVSRNPEKVLTVGLAAMDPFSAIKGGEYLLKLTKFCSDNPEKLKICLLKDFELDNQSAFWSEIDFMLVPSIIDNSPNVIHEAKRLGIPVIASPVGGITELLLVNFDILLEGEVLNFDNLIMEALKLLNSSEFISRQKVMISDYQKYIGNPLEKHIDLYISLL
jgi:glycosyltransferase involved in cell wall biosynthesis